MRRRGGRLINFGRVFRRRIAFDVLPRNPMRACLAGIAQRSPSVIVGRRVADFDHGMIAVDVIAKRRDIERLARVPAVAAQLGVFVAFPTRRVHHIVVFLAPWEHRASTAGRTSRGWINLRAVLNSSGFRRLGVLGFIHDISCPLRRCITFDVLRTDHSPNVCFAGCDFVEFVYQYCQRHRSGGQSVRCPHWAVCFDRPSPVFARVFMASDRCESRTIPRRSTGITLSIRRRALALSARLTS